MIDDNGLSTGTQNTPSADCARVKMLGIGSLGIAVVGGLITFDLLGGMSLSICYQDYAYLGEHPAYYHAYFSIAGTAWTAFGSLCLFTYEPSRAWRVTAVLSTCVLFIVGTITFIYDVLLSACQ